MRPHLLLALALGTVTAVLPAQRALTPAEVDAYALRSAGRHAAALDAFLALVQRDMAGDRHAVARAESHAAVATQLAEHLGAVDVATRFAELAAEPVLDVHPGLRDRLLHAVMRLRLAAADLEGVTAAQRELGYLAQFWICGPFDNERGQGWAREYPPESGFDPSATYEGKKRPVRWRPSPVIEPPGGVFDVGAMVRPAEQVLVYAATALVAEADRDAMLHLGTDGSYRVFLNGEAVGGRDLRRPRRSDQDVVALRLREGPNLLLLKICGQDGPLTFEARLRGADGRPLEGVRETGDEATMIAAAATQPAERADVELAPRAIDVLAPLAESDATAAFHLATLLAAAEPDDPGDRRDRALAEAAVAGLPGFPAARHLLAATRAQSGRAEEKDENRRRRDYEAILDTAPDDALALRCLAEMDLESVGAAASAEALCRRALEVEPDYVRARLLLARALEAQDLDAFAADETLRAAAPDAERRRRPAATRAAFEVAVRQRDHATAEELVRETLRRDADAVAFERLAWLLLRRGAHDEAVAVLRRGIEMFPFQLGPRQQLARALEGRGDLEGAAAVSSDWLDVCPEDDEVLVDLARLAGLQHEVDRQRELLRAAIELNPNRKAEVRLLEFLEADEVAFHLAYEQDADAVIEAAGEPPADAAAANDSHHWILQQDVVRAYRNGTRSVYQHRILRVLSDRAARSFSTWIARHDPHDQRARILSARVIKADGRELRPRLRGAFAQLPPLEIGDVVDVRVRIDDLAPTFFGDYFGLVHPLGSPDGQPVARSELVLVLDSGREYRFASSNGAPEPEQVAADDDVRVLRWALQDVPRTDEEERSPDWKETTPLVRVTTYRDWDAFASWWWNLIRRQSDVSPAMRAKVAELTADCATEQEKIAAIYSFVTNDVRYKAWEFGVHGYKPYNTSVIYERRHGDCKDKALLLNAMLGVVGIEAWPVLIWADTTRDADDLSLAMVEHFNHCISYVPAAEGRPALFLDGTATWHPTDTVPEMDQGARVLIVKGPQGEIAEVPYVAAADNVDERTYTLHLETNGAGRATMVATPGRNEAVGFREFLSNEPARRAENVERMLSGAFGEVDVVDVDAGAPEDVRRPVRLEVTFVGQDLATAQGGGLALAPVFDSNPLQRFTAAAERRSALLLGAPSSEHQIVHYRLPAGWAPVEMPAPVTLEAPFGSYALHWKFADGVLTVERRRAIAVARVESAEYPEFREFASRADAADARAVVVRPEGR